jgi:hypothetical protein
MPGRAEKEIWELEVGNWELSSAASFSMGTALIRWLARATFAAVHAALADGSGVPLPGERQAMLEETCEWLSAETPAPADARMPN